MTVTKNIWAVVPVKTFTQAKTRLSDILSATQRKALAQGMMRDVIRALLASPSIEKVVVITSDPEAQQIARELNAIALTDDQNAGQTAAVEQGMRFLKSQGVKIMLTLPADLPLLSADDVESFCALINSENEVVIAPAANDGGTNAIACYTNCTMCFHFGDDSFQKHKKSILAVDAKPIISTVNGFCLDVDRPEDLFEFLKTPSTTYSYELLSSLINPPVIRLHQTDRVST